MQTGQDVSDGQSEDQQHEDDQYSAVLMDAVPSVVFTDRNSAAPPKAVVPKLATRASGSTTSGRAPSRRGAAVAVVLDTHPVRNPIQLASALAALWP